MMNMQVCGGKLGELRKHVSTSVGLTNLGGPMDRTPDAESSPITFNGVGLFVSLKTEKPNLECEVCDISKYSII
jgi:hypothetical protein